MRDEVVINKEEFPSNSISEDSPGEQEAREEAKQSKKIISSTPIKRKGKSKVASSFKRAILSEDPGSIKQYLIFDVIIPRMKDVVVDTITSGIESLFYGRSNRRYSSTSSRIKQERTSYNNYYSSSLREPPRTSHGPEGRTPIEEVVLADRNEAEMVVDTMLEMVDQYGSCSVADFYDLVGISTSFVDADWGWENLSKANVRRVREGYLIDLPRPRSLR